MSDILESNFKIDGTTGGSVDINYNSIKCKDGELNTKYENIINQNSPIAADIHIPYDSDDSDIENDNDMINDYEAELNKIIEKEIENKKENHEPEEKYEKHTSSDIESFMNEDKREHHQPADNYEEDISFDVSDIIKNENKREHHQPANNYEEDISFDIIKNEDKREPHQLSENYEKDISYDVRDIIKIKEVSVDVEFKNQVVINHSTNSDTKVLQTEKNVHQPVSKIEETHTGLKQDVKISATPKCEVCATNVYPMEKVMFDSKIYHQTCFKCCKCKKSLSPTVVSKSNGKLFCKPHYINLFRIRGKYDDIDIDKEQPSSTTSTHIYTPTAVSGDHDSSMTNNTRSNETKLKSINAKDLAKKFEGDGNIQDNVARKAPIDIGLQRRVSDVTQAWGEGMNETSQDFKKGNSNNNYTNELENVNQKSKGSVKNLKARFESSN